MKRVTVTAMLALFCAVAASTAGARPAASPIPIWQRLVIAGEYTGFTPQAEPPTTAKLVAGAKFAASFSGSKLSVVTSEFRRDGYRLGVTEDLNGPDNKRSGLSAALQLGSNAGAVRLQKFFQSASLQPCPHSCSVAPSVIKPPGIPGALATERIRRVADSSKPDDQPFELVQVTFTDGPFLYALVSVGPPDGVDKGALYAAATRVYRRVKGAPPVS